MALGRSRSVPQLVPPRPPPVTCCTGTRLSTAAVGRRLHSSPSMPRLTQRAVTSGNSQPASALCSQSESASHRGGLRALVSAPGRASASLAVPAWQNWTRHEQSAPARGATGRPASRPASESAVRLSLAAAAVPELAKQRAENERLKQRLMALARHSRRLALELHRAQMVLRGARRTAEVTSERPSTQEACVAESVPSAPTQTTKAITPVPIPLLQLSHCSASAEGAPRDDTAPGAVADAPEGAARLACMPAKHAAVNAADRALQPMAFGASEPRLSVAESKVAELARAKAEHQRLRDGIAAMSRRSQRLALELQRARTAVEAVGLGAKRQAAAPSVVNLAARMQQARDVQLTQLLSRRAAPGPARGGERVTSVAMTDFRGGEAAVRGIAALPLGNASGSR